MIKRNSAMRRALFKIGDIGFFVFATGVAAFASGESSATGSAEENMSSSGFDSIDRDGIRCAAAFAGGSEWTGGSCPAVGIRGGIAGGGGVRCGAGGTAEVGPAAGGVAR